MAKKNKDLIYYVLGFIFLFGISGLIYGLLPYTLIIGAVFTAASFVLMMIILITKRKRKR